MKDESFNVHYKTGLSLLIRVTLVSFFFRTVSQPKASSTLNF
ncbi:hypothetical protein LG58_4829 [Kosakonia radicincitans YD4]|jgi:hypothetical protein|nr:hypothetical protein LG58_4829 [Kosakonia radicincitans YD4]